MEDRSPSEDLTAVGSSPTSTDPNATGDPLDEIDEIENEWLTRQEEAAAHSRQVAADRAAFADEFTRVLADRVRPAMEAVIERLRKDGGDGVITERPEDMTRLFTHRLTLWMSLHGTIEGAPRQDRHPYLQFDAHPDTKVITMSEGDMWQGKGGQHSGEVGKRQLSDLGPELVDQEVVTILRRAAK